MLKELEGKEFNTETQREYQTLLIQKRLYEPERLPPQYREYWEHSERAMSHKVAKEIFELKGYVDSPMRGRQSVNPLNKLGFSIARKEAGPIAITELGNQFLAGDYDIGSVFFKSLLKLQFPNPWSTHFSQEEGFDIMPLVATMRLIERVNARSEKKGLNQTEFSVFVPTLISAHRINERVEAILDYRKSRKKEDCIQRFAQQFYGITKLPQKKLNNLFDYGDNTMRYFRLTRYFKVTMDPLGKHWRIDLEPMRMAEIEQLLAVYDGTAQVFKGTQDYLAYLSDISMPQLPWEALGNLRKVAASLRNATNDLVATERLTISAQEQSILELDPSRLGKSQLEEHIGSLRKLHLDLKLGLEKLRLVGNEQRIGEIIQILRTPKALRGYEPEQFEKLVVEALKIINDEILIKPNYPIDDNGDPISHAPANRPDVECFYESFNATCEVTLNPGRLQWVQEGQPVMRHLRGFESQHMDKPAFCLFIAPHIHTDTYSQFWISVKHGYDGESQQIVPLTTEQFALVLEGLLQFVKQGKRLSHRQLHQLYSQIIEEVAQVSGFSEWASRTGTLVSNWKQGLVQ